MRWLEASYCDVNKLYSGTSNNECKHGVRMTVSKRIAEYVTNFVPMPVSKRLMLLYVDILQCMHQQRTTAMQRLKSVMLTYLMRKLPKQELTIVMGDFKSWHRCTGEHIRPWGLEKKNEREEQLNVFAEKQKMIILNKFLQLPPRKLYTWKSLMDTEDNTVGNQIDYMLVNKRCRNGFFSVKTYPEADLQSDHDRLAGICRVRMKKVRNRGDVRYNIRKIKNEA